jgi:hypothetical protein
MRLGFVICLCGALLACGSPKATSEKSAALTVRVDRRVEVMAILQRLAAASEYLGTPTTTYVSDVTTRFRPFSEHPAVVRTRELRAQYGIAFDAPMWLAVQLDDKLYLKGRPLDGRWANVDIDGYLVLVRDFVTATKFDEFFAAHAPYFARVEARLRGAIAKEDPTSWFDTFFGARPGAKFIVVAGMLTGTHNFGPHSETELYQILGMSHVDFDELPFIDDALIELLVHETAHAYINPLFAKHHAELAPHGERLLARVAEPMRKQAYPTWEIMLNEQGVRAVTTRYLRERKGAAAADAAIAREEARSFLWTRPLADLLGTYEAQRQQYPDLEAFMPKIVELFLHQ